MNNLTGKKVSIIAHSMGNLNILRNLSMMTQENKDKYIYNYIPIAPPYLGSNQANKIMSVGEDSYTTLGGYFGFHFDGSIKTTSN